MSTARRRRRRPSRAVVPAAALLALAALAGCATPPASTTTTTPTTPGAGAQTAAAAQQPRVTRAPFGRLPDGRAVELFTMTNAHGVEVRAMTYGGIITVLRTPDRTGRLDDVVLGYDSLAGYLKESPYFGAIVGRYANRIARGKLTLDGQTYTFAINNPPNTLHGGTRGFDKVLWSGEPFQSDSGAGVTLRYTSPDGEEGYPGTLSVKVTYTLTPRDELVVDYEATVAGKATPVNLSQHTYWNLAGTGPTTPPGQPLPTNAQHLLTLDASAYTPVDSTLIPTGEIAPVAGTPFDFRTATAIGARIGEQNAQLKYGGGYDHNWVLDRAGRAGLVHAARVAEPTTGRTLDISTTEPGIQFYSGNFLDGKIRGKGDRPYPYRSAIVLETQHFPDSPNHPNFPNTILRPGETLRSRTVFAFGAK
jgi:aldose 1-epimerase